MIIYITTNLINGKIYVGQDSKNNPKYFGSGIALNKAIKKYGKENFKKETLEYCKNKVELNEKEIYWIDKLNSTNNKIGYNIAKGGYGFDGVRKPFTKEHKENISKNHHDVSGVNNPMYGRHHSDAVKAKIKKLNTGRKATDEARAKMRVKNKGEGNANSKLTEKQVLLIRELYFENDRTLESIAIQFNVKKACIFKIVKYKTWGYL